MREAQELTNFSTLPTPVVGERSCVLWVPEKELRADSDTSAGTTLKNFLPKLDKGNAIGRGFGDYVLTQAGPQQDGLQAFYFARPRTTGEIATAFRSLSGVRLGIPWPAVFGSMLTGDLLAYDENGTSYVEGTIWKPVWARKFYDGPVSTLEEWFASHVPFDIPVAAGMQPRAETFDYGVGSVTIPECLHGAFTLTYSIGESTRRPAQTATVDFTATNLTDWPDFIVLQDVQSFEDGIYIRRRLKAFKPE